MFDSLVKWFVDGTSVQGQFRLFTISYFEVHSTVGASLLAMALTQSTSILPEDRYREQARSHHGACSSPRLRVRQKAPVGARPLAM
ncbi:hypothetical protein ACQR3P_27450, partial [Rhodococcus sp. IEGM1300]